MVGKSCRNLRKRVQSTFKLHIHVYLMFSLQIKVSVAEWLGYYFFLIPVCWVSVSLSVILFFIFFKRLLTERSLKFACILTEWSLKCNWNPPFPSPFSQLKGTISSGVYLFNYLKLRSKELDHVFLECIWLGLAASLHVFYMVYMVTNYPCTRLIL